VPTGRTGPTIGLIIGLVLLTVLAGTVGLGIAGWVAGVAYGTIMCAALTLGLHRSGAGSLGPADRVTLTRATLVAGVTALTADSFHRQVRLDVLVALAVVALLLDAVDGQVARRTGTVSAFGARFDMEVDAFLILVLSVYVARSMGAWVLTIGAMRYAFVVATWVLPWMRGSLPPRLWRKVVAATQGVVGVFAAADVAPRPLVVAALAASLAMLIESFTHDVRWLWRRRRLIGSNRRHGPGLPSRVGLVTRTPNMPRFGLRPEAVAMRYETVRNRSNSAVRIQPVSPYGHPVPFGRRRGNVPGNVPGNVRGYAR
jgi:phosphatidylglycerophosphate synthase